MIVSTRFMVTIVFPDWECEVKYPPNWHFFEQNQEDMRNCEILNIFPIQLLDQNFIIKIHFLSKFGGKIIFFDKIVSHFRILAILESSDKSMMALFGKRPSYLN